MTDAALLEVADLSVHFTVRGGWGQSDTVRAVDGVGFELRRGETLGLVGESGSGKSTIGRSILQILPATEGEIRLEGRSLSQLSRGELRRARRKLQMVFQDPYSSLNPRHRIGEIVAEPLAIEGVDRAARQRRVGELLELVGLDDSYAHRYPHMTSGGQRQRVAIARALAASPQLIVCDEPVSALDVSIQAQIVNLLERLQEELGIAYLFIAHDLAVVRHISDRVAVLYLGGIVETGEAELLYRRPLHPYTRALLSAVPVPDAAVERQRRRIILRGEIPSPANPPTGCRFASRCWLRERLPDTAVCAAERPPLRAAPDGRLVACHYFEAPENAPTA